MTAPPDQVRDWVLQQLDEHALGTVVERGEPRVRPWATTVRWRTTADTLWFKAAGPGTGHEAALLRLLAARAGSLVPEVVAVDPVRSWSLTRDAGPLLREALPAERSWSAWEVVVRRCAELQLRLADDRAAVLDCHVREVSARTLPGLAASLVDELSRRPPDAGGLTRDEADRLGGVLPRFGAWCAELDRSPVPDSVQHDDLHSGNVCWTASGDGRVDRAAVRVIDWGDATWGFPLTTMLVTLGSVGFHAGLPEGPRTLAPELARVRDAYLEPFTALAPRSELLRLVDLACRTGAVGRALCYRAALVGAPEEAERELEFPVRDWLLRLLHDSQGPQ